MVKIPVRSGLSVAVPVSLARLCTRMVVSSLWITLPWAASVIKASCTGSRAWPAWAMSSHCVEAGRRTPRSACIRSSR